jgi:hypothetical protein
MDFGKIIARVKSILTTPATEWPKVAAEPDSVSGLYTGYILIVAALPLLARFIKNSLIGFDLLGSTLRIPMGMGIASLIIGYVLSLVLTYLMALIVNALAPTFGGQKDMVQALKVVAYAWTASWIAGIAVLLPWIGTLIALAGAIYAIYLLYLGLPYTMRCPQEKAGGYTALSVVIGIVLSLIIGMVVGHLSGVSSFTKSAVTSSLHLTGADGSTTSLPTGKVESLPADQIRAFLPDSVDSLKRRSIDSERNAVGMQISSATAEYGDDSGHDITLTVADTGSMRGLMAMAGAMAPESDQETDHGYNKTYTKDGRLTHEQWDTSAKNGEYSVIVGQRFSVKANGRADSIDQLKQAVEAVDLSKLEALKDQGVSKN